MTSEEAELRIDHRDEFGRIQSAKEAFRTMSWRFHGKGPHWKNVERRVNRIQNDIKHITSGTNIKSIRESTEE
ncbi:conserved hypothetical protein [Perkinsus marinus ATCC 50983]|uniref:Uncharacterized protein n=1 Tax=Perkinsus marinus (strain ATCC 50983 / TXsc) TaxID=423536 RepID=C5LVE4_PERM5|nr:conserved hypothetical protein [Perkinsus marinus ATCC 50983]EEQ99297.1 conserved hypothetical protein [Perkinsus marinus ATCC 50983]|eukprot:XP_002766580.1 conserved hypothetical protein [Perkinsus marinus ATCC 50983]